MGLNRKASLLVILGVTLLRSAWASDDLNEKYLTIGKVTIREVTKDTFNQERKKVVFEKAQDLPGIPGADGKVDRLERTGKVISLVKDLVALGEDVYNLVKKGRPVNTTSYAPISVIPKDKKTGKMVDILDMENWNAPVSATYEVVYENLFKIDVVTFRYTVLFSYGGSIDGKGAYITGAQIIPESVSTLFGYDVTATMKLGGIQNNGTRDNPLAAATLHMEYTVSTMLKADLEVNTFHITGKGKLKAY